MAVDEDGPLIEWAINYIQRLCDEPKVVKQYDEQLRELRHAVMHLPLDT